MSLKEWCERAGVKPTCPTTERGAVSVVVSGSELNFTQLWHLDDFAVSSRCGPVVWLVPKFNQAKQRINT
jgi:hypothetical protein